MQRICTSLAANGFEVLLVGRKLKNSAALTKQLFQQKRIPCLFNKGFLFYAEYNVRLFWCLLFTKMDAICAIDLDTILPCYFVSVIKNKKRLYDAHELFTEQKEIVTRPAIHKIWLAIERFAVPKFKHGYTVNQFIVDELKRRYGVGYRIVRNLPVLSREVKREKEKGKTETLPLIIYQGAVNEGRSFETLIPAMKNVDAKLIICGKGNFFEEVKKLIAENKVEGKVELKGFVSPQELKLLTPSARVAVMLFERTGLNQYYSLSNRFFDHIMACVPQVCVNYPEYKAINDEYDIALMIDDTKEETIAAALNELINNDVLYEKLRTNCVTARKQLNWESEKKNVVQFYRELLG
jgi:glycosyltransferase involved in cell wall biosynthesis